MTRQLPDLVPGNIRLTFDRSPSGGFGWIDDKRILSFVGSTDGYPDDFVTLDEQGRRHGVEVEYFWGDYLEPRYARAWRHGVLHGPCINASDKGLTTLTVSDFLNGTGVDMFAGGEPDSVEVYEYEDCPLEVSIEDVPP